MEEQIHVLLKWDFMEVSGQIHHLVPVPHRRVPGTY